jgi:hypothetical protein
MNRAFQPDSSGLIPAFDRELTLKRLDDARGFVERVEAHLKGARAR